MRLTPVLFNNERPSKAFPLLDVEEIEFSNNAIGGYMDCNIKLSRKAGGGYIDTGFVYHCQILTEDGDVVWEGQVHSLPQSIGPSSYSFELIGIGYNSTLDEQDSWQPNYTSATDVAQVFRDGIASYAPKINVTTSSAPNTGRTIIFQPDNKASVRSFIDELIKNGNGSNQALYWQVWNNRTFYLSPRPASTAWKYETSIRLADDADIGIVGDSFFTRVTVRYKTDKDVKTVTVNNTSMQATYASSLGSPNTAVTQVNYVREPAVVDVTNHGIITDAQATGIANTLLSKYSNNGVRIGASKLTVSRPDAISSNGMTYQLEKLRAGQWILLKDLTGFDSSITPGQGVMFISSIKYSNKSRKLEISGEGSNGLDDLLSRILASIPVVKEANA